MSQKPAWLHEKPITLPNGDSALWSYDDEGDILEIFFDSAPASATVELADGVFLRFDRKSWRPLSLGFISATTRTQQQEFGPTLLALTGLTKLPELERKRILHILQTPPVSLILPLYSFKATARSQVIPVGLLAQPMPLAA